MKKKKLFTFHVQYTECLSKFVAHTVVIISHGKSMNFKKTCNGTFRLCHINKLRTFQVPTALSAICIPRVFQ